MAVKFRTISISKLSISFTLLKNVDLITFEKKGTHLFLTQWNDVLLWISTLKNKIMKLTLKKELPLIELY
jgi:hypothetical protein